MRAPGLDGRRRDFASVYGQKLWVLCRPFCSQSIQGTWISQVGDATGNITLFEVGTFSPDGGRIATADDRAAQIWDATSYRLLFTLPHGCEVYHAVYSADGTRLVTAAQTMVRIWDATSGALVHDLKVKPDNGTSSDYFLTAISPDGRFVAYRSAADNLVAGDTNGVPDIFLYDRLNGTTTLLTTNRFGHGSADNRSLTPVFSADGGTLAFVSWASDLIPNDFNSSADIFALDVYNGTIEELRSRWPFDRG